MKCVACESTNLVEGKMVDESGGRTIGFKTHDLSGWKAAFGVGYQEVSAYACVHCGNLQLNVNFSEEDKTRYLEFQGQQPDLLKRIESE